MRTAIITAVAIISTFATAARADDFLGAPILPGGAEIEKTAEVYRFSVPASPEEALGFYKERLAKAPDIRYRDWADEFYIEDDGRTPWHAIRISKVEKSGTVVTIQKDSWTWIFGTLLLRFVGVFVVIVLLYLAMLVSGAVISRAVGRQPAKA
jgi:hypothetical protein